MEKKICCICFYGATRTLAKTIDNIKKYIIDEFKNNFEVKIFIHTWKTNEETINDYKLVNPDYYELTDQSLLELDIEKYIKSLDNHYLNYDYKKLIPGLLYGLYSLKQVSLLMLSKIKNPDYVVFLRPDSKFEKFPSISNLINLHNSKSDQLQIITASFDNFYFKKDLGYAIRSKDGTGGANDRFAICCGSKAAEIYGTRYDRLNEYSKKYVSIPEIFLEWVIFKNKIKNIKSKDICFKLLRNDGTETGDCLIDD